MPIKTFESLYPDLPDMQILNFKSVNGSPAKCGVTFSQTDGRVTVTVTELRDNPGCSVTNQFEEIATWIFQQCLSDNDPATISWVEHYEEVSQTERFNGKRQTWDAVALQFGDNCFYSPKWTFIREEPIRTQYEEAVWMKFEKISSFITAYADKFRQMHRLAESYQILCNLLEEVGGKLSQGEYTDTVISWAETNHADLLGLLYVFEDSFNGPSELFEAPTKPGWYWFDGEDMGIVPSQSISLRPCRVHDDEPELTAQFYSRTGLGLRAGISRLQGRWWRISKPTRDVNSDAEGF